MGDPNIFSGYTPASTVRGYSRRAAITIPSGPIVSVVVPDANVTADNIILFSVENQDANITLDNPAIYISSRSAGTSFTLTLVGTAAAEGTLHINYVLVES